MTIHASASTVAPGQGVSLSATIDTYDNISAPLILESRPSGAGSFELVDDAPFLWNGGDPIPASLTVHPSVQTQYRWSYAGNDSYESAYSPVTTVDVQAPVTIVQTAVTIVPKSLRIRKGRNLVVTGVVDPRRGAVDIVLQRKVSGVWKSWKATTTTSTGSYLVKKRMLTTGRRYIRVVTGSDAGHLSGTSVVKRIRIVS